MSKLKKNSCLASRKDKGCYDPKLQTKSIVLFLVLFFAGSPIFAQVEQFVWTGNAGPNWTSAGSWDYYAYGGTSGVTATYYPGQGGLVNPNGGADDIAIFGPTNVGCTINPTFIGSTSGLRVGGLIVAGYLGELKQANGNRLIISDAYSGPWNSTELLDNSGLPSSLDGTTAYRAYFDFGTGGEFKGNEVDLISLYYCFLTDVPLTITSGGTFTAPVNSEMAIRQEATIDGTNFVHNGGLVLINPKSADAGSYDYDFDEVIFHDLKIGTGGAAPREKSFVNSSNIVVKGNFHTTGVNGQEDGSGSGHIIMNETSGAEIEIEGDIFVQNKWGSAALNAIDAWGNIVLVLTGNVEQTIDHTLEATDYTGNLPALRIEQGVGGFVTLEGPVTVNDNINFVNGIVNQSGPFSSQNNLTNSGGYFVLNTNTTVSACTDNSYCEGPIKCRTGKSIELPLGKNGTYRPAVIDYISGISDENTYMAEYFDATPMVGVVSLAAPLMAVSDCEVWAIQKAKDSDSYVMDLELSFDDESCSDSLIKSACGLVVARWDDSPTGEWQSHGKESLFNTVCSFDNTVKSDLNIITSDFERSTDRPDLFTFGNIGLVDCDSCLVSVYVDYCVDSCTFTFDPMIDYGDASSFHSILWDFGIYGTSNALNPSITFTSTGILSINVTVCAIAGIDTCCVTHSFRVYINGCEPSMSLAPLFNPNSTLENLDSQKKLANEELDESENETSLKIVPNPSVNGQIQIGIETSEVGNFKYEITNNQGEKLIIGNISDRASRTIDTSQLTPGMYFITVHLSDKKVTERFMVVE